MKVTYLGVFVAKIFLWDLFCSLYSYGTHLFLFENCEKSYTSLCGSVVILA